MDGLNIYSEGENDFLFLIYGNVHNQGFFILKIEKWTKWDNIIFKIINIIIIIIKTKKGQDYC